MWLEPATVDVMTRCWVVGALSKVGCSEVSTMVGGGGGLSEWLVVSVLVGGLG
jgi:hypothetical protein